VAHRVQQYGLRVEGRRIFGQGHHGERCDLERVGEYVHAELEHP